MGDTKYCIQLDYWWLLVILAYVFGGLAILWDEGIIKKWWKAIKLICELSWSEHQDYMHKKSWPGKSK